MFERLLNKHATLECVVKKIVDSYALKAEILAGHANALNMSMRLI
jgi:hypothetical protein